MELSEFRARANQCADWVADYLEIVETYPVRSQVRPGDVLKALAASCPEQPEPMADVFADFQASILPGITHWQHPKFFAYFNANSSPPSVLAEFLTAGLAAQCMLWETSPAAAELEMRMMEWLRELLALPKDFVGSIQDSGSASNLCAILAGANHATRGRFAHDGAAGASGPLMIYASAEAHSSVEKGVRIAGIGAANLRKIPIRDDLGLDPEILRRAIAEDRDAGRVPACIVASFGGTGLGSIDPLRAIGEIARRENIHYHVDAAWAGSGLILPEVRPLAEGVELADSFVFNPHKWLFTNFDCSAFFMRETARLTGVLSLTPAYLQSTAAADIPEYRDWSIALGRRFRALKLWFVLRTYGAGGLRAKLREHIAWTQRLADRIRKDARFELVTEPRLALLAFRYRGAQGDAEDLDALNEELLKRINGSGRLYLTKTLYRGRVVIRFVIGQTYTTQRHVEEGWNDVVEIAATL